MAEARDRLHWHCDQCETACEHVGAAFLLILEEKMALGLAAPPPERKPVESLSEAALVKAALDERVERARTENMKIVAADPDRPWTDYTVTSLLTGKSYRVALRSLDRGPSYCSCPDFRNNTLGTCKHILKVQAKVKRRRTGPASGRRKIAGVFSREQTCSRWLWLAQRITAGCNPGVADSVSTTDQELAEVAGQLQPEAPGQVAQVGAELRQIRPQPACGVVWQRPLASRLA
jgi:hypothetical protein